MSVMRTTTVTVTILTLFLKVFVSFIRTVTINLWKNSMKYFHVNRNLSKHPTRYFIRYVWQNHPGYVNSFHYFGIFIVSWEENQSSIITVNITGLKKANFEQKTPVSSSSLSLVLWISIRWNSKITLMKNARYNVSFSIALKCLANMF